MRLQNLTKKIWPPLVNSHHFIALFFSLLLGMGWSNIVHSQSLEIHHISVDDADCSAIIVRDTTAVRNILDFEVLRRILTENDFINLVKAIDIKARESGLNRFNIPRTEFLSVISSAIEEDDNNKWTKKVGDLFTDHQDGLFEHIDNKTNMTEVLLRVISDDENHYERPGEKVELNESALLGTVLHVTVIDAGRTESGEGIYNYLIKQGIEKINNFILSHRHNDHYGGFSYLADKLEIENCYLYTKTAKSDLYVDFYKPMTKALFGLMDTNAGDDVKAAFKKITDGKKAASDFSKMMNYLIDNSKKLHIAAAGDTFTLNENLNINMICIASDEKVIGHPDKKDTIYKDYKSADDENNKSLAWILSYKNFTYYTAGDLGGYNTKPYKDTETPLATALEESPGSIKYKGHVCAMKISHHGSDKSTNTTLLGQLRTKVGIIPIGYAKHQKPKADFFSRIYEFSNEAYDDENDIEEIFTLGLKKINRTLDKKSGSGYQPWGYNSGKKAKAGIRGWLEIAPTNKIEFDKLTAAEAEDLKVPRLIVAGSTVIVVCDSQLTGNLTDSDFIVKHDGEYSIKYSGLVKGDQEKYKKNVETPVWGVHAFQCNRHQ